jgi:hypothetical protein
MPPLALHVEIRELVDPEERRARNVLVQITLAPRLDPVERVPAVDEPVLDQ